MVPAKAQAADRFFAQITAPGAGRRRGRNVAPIGAEVAGKVAEVADTHRSAATCRKAGLFHDASGFKERLMG